MLIEASKCCLLIVDMQEKLLPVIFEAERVADKCALLLQAADKLDLPIIISEQYSKGLGPTIQELEHKQAMIFDKLSFSVMRNETMKAHFKKMEDSGFTQVILCGVEAHVPHGRLQLPAFGRGNGLRGWLDGDNGTSLFG